MIFPRALLCFKNTCRRFFAVNSELDIRDDAAEAQAGDEVPEPLEADGDVRMRAREAKEMDEHPGEPGEESFHLEAAVLDDSAAATDGRHRPHVLVLESLELRLAVQEMHDVACADERALRGDWRDRRERALRAVLEMRTVADGEHAVAALDAQMLVNDDAAAAVDLAAAVRDERHGLDAGRPDDGLRRDRRAVFEAQRIAVIVDDLCGNCPLSTSDKGQFFSQQNASCDPPKKSQQPRS